ncbi:MAG: hypothetical protein IKY52_07515 [Clostridia bacterium]|nr:hypothetical protein [Clostridia bacterium]
MYVPDAMEILYHGVYKKSMVLQDFLQKKQFSEEISGTQMKKYAFGETFRRQCGQAVSFNGQGQGKGFGKNNKNHLKTSCKYGTIAERKQGSRTG